MEITIGQEEKAAGKMSDSHLAQAAKAVRENGYANLEDVIEHHHLDTLRERMDADSQTLIAAK